MDVLLERAEVAGAEIVPIVDRSPIDFRAVRQLARLCQERNVRIWHAHDDKTNLWGLLISRKIPLRLVTTLHGWVNYSISPWKVRLYKACSKFSLRRYDHSIAVSPDLLGQLQKWGISPDKSELIENAIDTDHYQRVLSKSEAREQLGMSRTDLVLVALGRLSPEKGFDSLISAVAIVRRLGIHLRLYIGGTGGLYDELNASIKKLALSENVFLMGQLSDPRTILQAADMFVLSSRKEGLPNVVLEAMAMETPVIATCLPGVSRLIEDGTHGLLVEADNPQQLADAICRLSSDYDLANQLARNARLQVEQNFDFDARMRKVARVYDTVLDRRSN